MNLVFANGIKALHIFILIFILFGSLTPLSWLPYHMIFVGVVMAHWWTNKGECLLTQWENRFRGEAPPGAEGQFVKQIFALVGIVPSNRMLLYIIYFVMFLSAGHSFYRWSA